MNTYSPSEHIPGEDFLISCLQKNIGLSINNKIIKRGRLLLFRRYHYFVQLALMTEKGNRENLDIPIPFNVEHYLEDGLLYFDYRLSSLNVENLPNFPEKVSSIYFNNILEVHIINNFSLKPFVASH